MSSIPAADTESLQDLSLASHGQISAEGKPRVSLRSSPKYPLLSDGDDRAAAEYFGVLRSRVLNARAKAGVRSIVVTSPQKQDGKSLTSLNLAISLAQLQKEKILLVDGDLRARGITHALGLEDSAGLGDRLTEQAPIPDCIRSTELSHLDVVPSGNVPQELLPGLLEGEGWRSLVREMSRDYGLVIVDSVPVSVPIADFELLLAACDALLLVVQIRKTKREALERTVRQLDGKLLGVVVNNIDVGSDADVESYYGERSRK